MTLATAFDVSWKPLIVSNENASRRASTKSAIDVALGSRILCGGARAGGMPFYKYVANRALTAFENLLLGARLSEYHTGLRAYARHVLETLPLAVNSDDFVFDNQVLAQAVYLACVSTRSLADALFPRGVFDWVCTQRALRVGGCGEVNRFRLQRWRIARFSIFDPAGAKVSAAA